VAPGLYTLTNEGIRSAVFRVQRKFRGERRDLVNQSLLQGSSGGRRPGSHVPYQSQIELRAAYMPDAAWAVSGHPPSYQDERWRRAEAGLARGRKKTPGGKLKLVDTFSLRGPFPALQPDGKLSQYYGGINLNVNEINFT
jgi:hypothetical protein